MPTRSRPASFRARPALAALALASAACLVTTATTRDGDLLPDARLAAIRDGVTTRREVLDWLGPPLVVVARAAESVRVPELIGWTRLGSTAAPAAAFFEPFAPRTPAPGDVVYFYSRDVLTTRYARADLQARGAPDTGLSHRRDRLWVLVDVATGVVQAHVHARDPAPAAAADAGETP